MPLSGSPVPVVTLHKEKPHRLRSSQINSGYSPDPLPKGAKALREEAQRLLRSAKIAWEAAASAKYNHELERRRYFDRIDKLIRIQEYTSKELSELRDEVKKLTHALKK
jgi:hypothetical protein